MVLELEPSFPVVIRKMANWLNNKFPIVGLSPMDGVTDEPFRLTQCHVSKPDVIFTEFVSAEGLAHDAIKLYDHLLYLPEERPIIAQLFGKDPDSFYQAAQILCHLGFDGIDINFGCPAKKVTQHGSGAAIIANPKLAGQIISVVNKAIEDFKPDVFTNLKAKTVEVIKKNQQYSQLNSYKQPTLSVKTRLGLDTDISSSWIEFLSQQPLDLITLHGRTLKQGYSGEANWLAITAAAKIAHDHQIKFFGNGDIATRQQGIEYCQQYQVNGVLIGRATMGNPWAFTNQNPSWSEKFQTMVYHLRQFQQVFPHRRVDVLRRDFLLYTHNHPHAKELRQKIVQISQIDQLLSIEDEFTNC